MRPYLRIFALCLSGLILSSLLLADRVTAKAADDLLGLPHASAAPQAAGFTQLVAGSLHTCGLTTTGGVQCWGNNWFGQLGDGAWLDRSVPADVVGLTSGVTAIAAASGNTTCALLADKTVRCWGMNFDGQLGNGTTEHSNVPVAVSGLSNVTAIGAGEAHMCAVLAGGGLRCWGANEAGQLGDGSTAPHGTPVAVQGLGGQVVEMAGGRSHTCAILQGGSVQCWGDNSDGQLGNGQRGVSSRTPVNVSGLAGAALQLAGEYNSACALLQSGAIACWGWVGGASAQVVQGWETGMSAVALGGLANYCGVAATGAVSCAGAFNESGQLGNGTTMPHDLPQTVVGIAGNATQVVMGSSHACAMAGTQAWCWGSNQNGQLGAGEAIRRTIALNTSGGPWAQVSAGSRHTCGTTAAGAAKCWGNNSRGQLGNRTYAYSSTPAAVQGLSSGVKHVSAGGAHSCAVLDNGSVLCWGYNRSGQLGNGSGEFQIPFPVAVSGLSSGVRSVAAGAYFTCALLDAGTVKCWGNNSSGQLGNGGGTGSTTPVDVTGLPGIVAEISAGQSHACARLADGQVYCWGGNYGGEIGDGTSGNKRPLPTPVQSLGQAVAISAGDYMTCAALATGGVKCWGAFDRQSGEPQLLPADIPGMDDVVAVDAGSLYACALEAGGGVQCFGANDTGQLGDGTLNDRQTVSYTLGLAAGVDQLSAGDSHVCALLDTGGLRCWGAAGDGQLGNGGQARFYTATPVVDAERQELFVNYSQGRVGSQFTLTGFGFEPNGSVQLLANGVAIGRPIAVNASGSFVAVLDTAEAGEGYYLISAQPAALAAGQSTSREVSIVLDNSLPQVMPEGGGAPKITVSGGIAVEMKFLYLPVQMR